MEFKRITLLMIYLSTSIAQEDSAKFQACLNDALPSIQAEMMSFHKAWKNFGLSPYRVRTRMTMRLLTPVIDHDPSITKTRHLRLYT